jgi:hypothetical protein
MKLSASDLCKKLAEIKLISHRVPEESDEIYKMIVAKGNEVLPCLIEKISDQTKTPDPRQAPKWQHYVVGDTAVFAVLHIVSEGNDERWKELFLAPLPASYQEEWKTNGVYAYFNYVSEPKHRETLQVWWHKWNSDN